MKMPRDILTLVAHLRDFLADVEQGRRPDYNTLERASLKYATLKYKLRMLPAHETVVVGGEEPDLLPAPPTPNFEAGIGPVEYASPSNPPLDPGNE